MKIIEKLRNIHINKKWKIIIAIVLIAIVISSVVYVSYELDINGKNLEDQQVSDDDTDTDNNESYIPDDDEDDDDDNNDDEPEGQSNIVIENIKGGTDLKATIKNTGDASATDVKWSISVTRSGILRKGKEIKQSTGTISTLAPGEEAEIQTGMILGIGRIEVRITANDKVSSVSGTQLLIFTRVK